MKASRKTRIEIISITDPKSNVYAKLIIEHVFSEHLQLVTCLLLLALWSLLLCCCGLAAAAADSHLILSYAMLCTLCYK